MEHPILSANGLRRQLGDRLLWKDLSFELFPEERVGLIGPSGSGKTLLLRTLVLLDPLQQGQITFQGRPLKVQSITQYRTQVIYLPQRPAAFDGTVEDNLKRVFTLAAQTGLYQRSRIEHYLAILNRAPDFLDQLVRRLSGGESQILALLRALQLQPKVLLLDEPTASLDPDATQQVEALVHQWMSEDTQRACLWTSHNPQQIQRVTNRQIDLKDVG
ncbi:MAG: ATP-binding cassette domain-containing protein [Elainellaceae cyanobacterium]